MLVGRGVLRTYFSSGHARLFIHLPATGHEMEVLFEDQSTACRFS